MNEATKERAETKMSAVVPSQRVLLNGRDSRVRIPAGEVIAEPQIELIREGNVIRAIEVTCSCGKRVRLVCGYE